MTPKEKAQELVESMAYSCRECDYEFKAKQCALIAVDEIIQEVYNIDHQHSAVYDTESKYYNYNDCKELKFWKEVKQEIEKL